MENSVCTARDGVLVCANEPLRSELAELVRARGFEAIVSVAPLQAIEALLHDGERICHALIASDLPQGWGHGLREFLADEYPHVRSALVSAG